MKTIETKTTVKVTVDNNPKTGIADKIMPKADGALDMVIAFDTTGSMAAYIAEVRKQVSEMVPRLFAENPDLRLGIVAFGDYCDMEAKDRFGRAYQCMPLTDKENDLVRFVCTARNTGGGDYDEFYELVLKKIIDEQPWREDSTKSILLIADAVPHAVGYTCRPFVVDNQIDWRDEARRAARMNIKIDTVSMCGELWYEQLSQMTNGICVPFSKSGNTSAMIETAATARSVEAYESRGHMDEGKRLRIKLERMHAQAADEEMRHINERFRKL